MFKKIEGLPDDVVGIEVSGKLTHDDYAGTLIPLVEKTLAEHKSIKILCVMAEGFDGMELAAMWDDTAFGLKHWHDISHIALVAEQNWVRAMTAMFAPFYPGIVRMFGYSDLEDAREWIAKAHHEEAA
ncbi:MAG: STAS/SEC14 domain-containing protein [Rhodospirillales bacterium]|nr:STAS/SEC14 domain-containing protein [Rhodospirillales bacterium]